ncbi:MAG TPA: hypothetical protein VFS21_05785 [Roseiflexaceae bacterium]|nr:hypothetical protein [Roseiflexaceae bacterium]
MTKLYQENKTCAVCGVAGSYTEIGSSNRFGAPDLDTRPPEMLRSTIAYWLHRCPACGYCAPDIDQAQPGVAALVSAPGYQAQSQDPAHSELANRFLCWALIQEQLGDHSGAGWSRLRAAWVCDDERRREAAVACRRNAAETLLRARAQGESFIDGQGGEEALLADLLRRSGQFERAVATCQDGLAREPEPPLRQILLFQQARALAEDGEWYTMEDTGKRKA